MEAQTVDTLPPIAADHDPVRCLLAIELSKKSWIIAVNSPLVDRIGRYSLEVSDWECLLERIERIRMRVARELNRPVEVISCYEAACTWIGAHDGPRRTTSMRCYCFARCRPRRAILRYSRQESSDPHAPFRRYAADFRPRVCGGVINASAGMSQLRYRPFAS
jgi:hypothetical protein